MTRDWSKPSGYARWGWVWAAVAGLGGVPNFIGLTSDPGDVARWVVAAITVTATAFCIVVWRMGVRDDRDHRAFMADWDRKWGIR